MPRPKWCIQMRLTIARAVNGLLRSVNQWANARRRPVVGNSGSSVGNVTRPPSAAVNGQGCGLNLLLRLIEIAAMKQTRDGSMAWGLDQRQDELLGRFLGPHLGHLRVQFFQHFGRIRAVLVQHAG